MSHTKTENKYLDNEYETETIVPKRIIEIYQKTIEGTIDEYKVNLDVSKYPKTKAKKRVVAYVPLKS